MSIGQYYDQFTPSLLRWGSGLDLGCGVGDTLTCPGGWLISGLSPLSARVGHVEWAGLALVGSQDLGQLARERRPAALSLRRADALHQGGG